MKIIIFSMLLLLVCLPLSLADIYITEVMHSPDTMSDSDGEWIEVYNDGVVSVDLSNWTIDGSAFDDVTIDPESYVVIARELEDGTDEDTDSFQSQWGTDILAVDGSFSLTQEDTIVLTNGIYTENVSYNKSFGGTGGQSITRSSLTEWEAQAPSPGNGSFSTTDGGLMFYVIVKNSAPTIVSVEIEDDSSAEGFQVMPNVDGEENVSISVVVNDSNGFSDVSSVTVVVNNETYSLSFVSNDSSNVATYEGSFTMDLSDLAGE